MPDELLDQLNSKNKTVREGAVRHVAVLPPAELAALIDLAIARHPRRLHCGFRRSKWLLESLPQTAAAVYCYHRYGWAVVPFAYLVVCFMSLCFWAFLKGLLVPRHPFTQIARAIKESEDPGVIGPALKLLEAPLAVDTALVKAYVIHSLIRHLPSLRHDQAQMLTRKQMHTMLSFLGDPLDRERHQLCLRILRALEQVGGADAVPVVRQLAAKNSVCNPSTPRKRWKQEIRQAAQECLPFLEQRAEEERLARTLLRAADASATTPDLLLRPVSTGDHAALAEQLLRAQRNVIGTE